MLLGGPTRNRRSQPSGPEVSTSSQEIPGGILEPMIDREDLESLSSAQLHDRAIGSAKAGGDIDWLWHVLGSMPAAEGAIGDLEDSGIDVAATVSAINGYLRADPGLADALRPQYVDYLLEQQ